MQRGEIRLLDTGDGLARRPVLVVSATATIPSLSLVTVAPVTTTLRNIPTHVPLGGAEGFDVPCAAACDQLQSVRTSDLDPAPVGALSPYRFDELDRAIAIALDMRVID